MTPEEAEDLKSRIEKLERAVYATVSLLETLNELQGESSYKYERAIVNTFKRIKELL